MSESVYIKKFIDTFNGIKHSLSRWEIWNDFLYMSAAAFANVWPSAEREQREEKYLELINKYDKTDQEKFTRLLSYVVMALEENSAQDFLGTLYMRLQLNCHQKGQFFSPFHIAELMAEVSFDGVQEQVEKKGLLTFNDPACGAGCMPIAFANVCLKHKINYQQNIYFVCQDIDTCAALMCYVQLSILGCPATVIVGNSIVKPGFHPDNQIWNTPFYYLNEWRIKAYYRREEEGEGDLVVEEEHIVEKVIEMPDFKVEESGQLSFMFDLAA